MATKPPLQWHNVATLPAKRFVCGHCGADVSVDKGYYAVIPSMSVRAHLYICHGCKAPTFFNPAGGHQSQVPGVPYGDEVSGITDAGVDALYAEARRATSAGCHTAAVLCCRKLLMHVAVAHGAKEGDKFTNYVDHLATKNLIPPGAKEWVDHIRNKSNEANHEIAMMSPQDAQELLEFTAMLLKLVYEFPARMKTKIGGAAKQ